MAPLLTEESLECNTRVNKAHWLSPPTWQTEEVPPKEADRSWPNGETWAVPIEGEDQKCPPPLEPHLQELLGGEEPSPAGAKAGDALPPPLTSMPKDPEPSPLHHKEWIEWHARHIPTPSWWEELVEIPGQKDYKLFARKVHASLKVPKACNWAKGVDIDHTPTGTSLNREVPFPTTPRWPVWHSGLSTHPVTAHSCLCECTAILGWEGPTTHPWPTLPSGRKYGGTPAYHGPSSLICRRGGFCGHCAIQLDGGKITQANGTHLVRPPCSHMHSQSHWANPRGSLLVAHGEQSHRHNWTPSPWQGQGVM